jgi:hypothetical protein
VLLVQAQAHHAQVRARHVPVQVLHVPAQVQVLNAAQPAVRHKADVTAIAMATSGKKSGINDCLCLDSYCSDSWALK